MSLPHDTITALTQEHVLPVFHDLVFRSHPLTKILMDKRKTYNDRRIEVLLEYAQADLCQFTGRNLPYSIGTSDPITRAYYEPKTLTVPLAIAFEDEVDNAGPGKVADLVVALVKNLQKSADAAIAARIFDRGSTGTYEWASLDDLIGTGNLGGITTTEMMDPTNAYSLWQSHLINAQTAYEDDASSTAENLKDPTSDVYLYSLIKRGIRKASYGNDERPKIIIMSSYLFDILDWIFIQYLHGSPISQDTADLGFRNIRVDGVPCIPDEDIVRNQTSDNDSRIYFVNTDYLYFYFNAKANFKMVPFVEGLGVNTKVMKIIARGGMVISNRRAQARIYNLYTPRDYAAPATS